MTFEDGFEAIASIKTSGSRLQETVSRLEVLEERLERLDKSQLRLDAVLKEARAAVGEMSSAAKELSAENAKLVRWTKSLPELVTQTVEKRLLAVASDLEVRLTDCIRNELRDTRATLRDAFENGAVRSEKTLLATKEDIIAEMPRGLFGRRGKR
jgi:predicted transcriptional regulator